MGISRRTLLKAGIYGGLCVLWNKSLLAGKKPTSIPPHEARFYHSTGDGTIVCDLCLNSCRIPPDGVGACRCRINAGGRLYTLSYNRPVALHRDPIEKLPMRHVLPGQDVLCIGTAGCNFSCLYCINHHLSQYSPDEVEHLSMTPPEIVQMALDQKLKGVAFSYNEPTVAYEYMCDTFEAARTQGLKTLFHTNGFMQEEPLKRLLPLTSAVVVDFKAFSSSAGRLLTGRDRSGIRAFLKAVHESPCFLEIVNLMVPGYNDGHGEIEGICGFIENQLSRDVPIHFSRFFPKYRLPDLSPTPSGSLREAVAAARRSHLRFAYSNNIQDENNHTFCPRCRHLLIKRQVARIQKMGFSNGRCSSCGQEIPGIWEA